ncbi:SMC-Scp complex subunit ScpB [Lysobacter koreensis]|uniref:SMC-Scp complex subunit ScpB n=1 Tax=Lysobacter koreensis TaxID=266122 RepID=A0ABW2YJ92_9GAMM
MDQALITRIVEAALLAANQPLTLAQLHGLFAEDQPAPADSVEQALETLRGNSAERGVELVELASGFRYQVQADVHPWVARLWTDRKTKYTRATLETLALIAYRQPITRGEIEQVRGVAVSSNIIQSLEEREWIRVVGHRDVPGKPALFGTTKAFLDYFGLKRLDELPPLSELKDIGELEPQLQFDGIPADGKPISAGGIASGAGVEASNADANDDGGDDGFDTSEASAGADTDLSTTEHPEPTAPTAAPSADDEGDPDAAPGERAADVNDPDQDTHAVETTTDAFNGNATETQTESDELDRSEQQK